MGSPLINLGKVDVKGFFKLEAFKPLYELDERGEQVLNKDGDPIVIGEIEGSRRILADWFENKLLTSGKNGMATQTSWMTGCQVGTDNTAAAAGQTGLLGWQAGTATIQTTAFGAQASAPFYGWKRNTYRFAVGETAANLNEVGVGWGTTAGANLITRALIVDGGGSPTTVTPLADEILDVVYEFRYYPPLGDSTGQVTLNGVVYDYTCRAAVVTDSTAWASRIGLQMSRWQSATAWAAYDGAIGTIEQNPSGVVANCDNSSQTDTAYSNNSFERKVNTTCGPSGWNLASGGIRCLTCLTQMGAFQTSFAAASGGGVIPKTVNFTMAMSWVVGWTEATIP